MRAINDASIISSRARNPSSQFVLDVMLALSQLS